MQIKPVDGSVHMQGSKVPMGRHISAHKQSQVGWLPQAAGMSRQL
jgi:hypothetical protein